MSKEPDTKDDPQLSFATTEQLIDELGKRCRALLVVFSRADRKDNQSHFVEIFRRNALGYEAIGLADYARQRIYDGMVRGKEST